MVDKIKIMTSEEAGKLSHDDLLSHFIDLGASYIDLQAKYEKLKKQLAEMQGIAYKASAHIFGVLENFKPLTNLLRGLKKLYAPKESETIDNVGKKNNGFYTAFSQIDTMRKTLQEFLDGPAANVPIVNGSGNKGADAKGRKPAKGGGPKGGGAGSKGQEPAEGGNPKGGDAGSKGQEPAEGGNPKGGGAGPKGQEPAEGGNPKGGNAGSKDQKPAEGGSPKGGGTRTKGQKTDGDAPNDGGDAESQSQASAKSKGRKATKIPPRRKEDYIFASFTDFEEPVFIFDDIAYTQEQMMTLLGADDPSKIRLKLCDFDIYTTMEVVPAFVYPLVHISPRFRNGDTAVRNPHYARPIQNSIASGSILAHVMSQYFNMAVPLARQERKQLPRMGCAVQDARIAEWMEKVYDEGFKYVFASILQYINSRDVRVGDETYGASKENQGNGYLWGVRTSSLDPHAVPCVGYVFSPSHSAVIPQAYFGQSEGGFFLTDGNKTYDVFARRTGDIILASCWQHARRPLIPFLPTKEEVYAMPDKTEVPISWRIYSLVGSMIAAEKDYKDLTPEKRLVERIKHSRHKADRVFALAEKAVFTAEYKNDKEYANAIDYIRTRKEKLLRVFEDGRIPMTTTEIERDNIGFSLLRNNSKAWEKNRRLFQAGAFLSINDFALDNGIAPEEMYAYIIYEMPRLFADRSVLDRYDKYEKEFTQKCEEALKKVKECPSKDPGLDLSGMTHQMPDLSYIFEAISPRCPRFQEFHAMYMEEQAEQRRRFAHQMTQMNLQKSPFSKEILLSAVDALEKSKEVSDKYKAYLPGLREDIGRAGVSAGHDADGQKRDFNGYGMSFPKHGLYWTADELRSEAEKQKELQPAALPKAGGQPMPEPDGGKDGLPDRPGMTGPVSEFQADAERELETDGVGVTLDTEGTENISGDTQAPQNAALPPVTLPPISRGQSTPGAGATACTDSTAQRAYSASGKGGADSTAGWWAEVSEQLQSDGKIPVCMDEGDVDGFAGETSVRFGWGEENACSYNPCPVPMPPVSSGSGQAGKEYGDGLAFEGGP